MPDPSLNPTPPSSRSRTAQRVLSYIASARGPVGIRELTAAFPFHENALRKHLRRLRDAGVLVESVDHQGATGRPRLLWELDATYVDPLADARPYEVLSRLLVGVAAGRPAREVGLEYGKELVRSAPDRAPVDLLVEVMRGHGFEPEVHADGTAVELILQRCPFATAAAAGAVVCELHLGIAEGVTAGAPEVAVDGLTIAPPHVGGCRIHVQQEHPRLSPAAPAEEAHP